MLLDPGLCQTCQPLRSEVPLHLHHQAQRREGCGGQHPDDQEDGEDLQVSSVFLQCRIHTFLAQELHRPAGAARGEAVQYPELHDDVHLRLHHEHPLPDEAVRPLAYLSGGLQ